MQESSADNSSQKLSFRLSAAIEEAVNHQTGVIYVRAQSHARYFSMSNLRFDGLLNRFPVPLFPKPLDAQNRGEEMFEVTGNAKFVLPRTRQNHIELLRVSDGIRRQFFHARSFTFVAPSAPAQWAQQKIWPSSSTPWPIMPQPQCGHAGARAWMAHSRLSKTCFFPARMISKDLS